MVERYRNLVYDSDRWTDFPFRPDDIVISTPPKCGTTWTQMLCASLIFNATTFDRPLAHISPWVDMQTRSLPSVMAELEAQTHRRFIKTHTPLDGLPLDERVTFLCVGRDPRDVAISWDHHWANLDLDAFMALRADAVGLDDLAELGPPPADPPEDARERFWHWVYDEGKSSPTLAGVLHHLQTFWDRRDQPNVALFHYSDLSVDLTGQLRRLADLLSIPMSEERIKELAAAATFDRMKGHAADLAPNADEGFWRSTDDFFHRGSSGQWRQLLDQQDLHRYRHRVDQLIPADLSEWAHHGWINEVHSD